MPYTRWFTRCFAALIAAACLLPVPHASAQNAIGDANARVLPQRGWKSAAEELFPRLAAMTPPPDRGMSDRQATLMTPRSPSWSAWSEWAGAAPQQEALDALKTVTDPKERYTLGLPYGESGVDANWVKAGLYVDLGAPPLLGRAPRGMKYLDHFSLLTTLATIESARRAESGDAEGAVNVLINWVRLGRMVADREFLPEKQWGITQMIAATERMRDIAYLYPDLITEKVAQDAVAELDQRSLTPERIRFPEGERIALQELLSAAMEDRGGPSQESFAATMGRLTAQGRSLNVFSEASHWARLQSQHAGFFDTRDQISRVFGDWQKRWDLNNIYDPLMRTPTDYSRMDTQRFAMIQAVVDGMEDLFDLRTRLMVAVGGTRSAMGVIGFRARHKQWPPNLLAVQPQFVRSLDYDPWSYDPKLETSQVYRYFVPVRDAVVGPREQPRPHEMQVLIVRDNSLAGADASSGDPFAGVFPPKVGRAFRDALAEGLPSGLFDPQTGAVRLGAFRDHLVAELAKLGYEPIALKNLQDHAKRIDESSATILISVVDPARLMTPELRAARESMELMAQQIGEILAASNALDTFRSPDGQIDIARFRETAISGIRSSELPQEMKDAIASQIENLPEAQMRLAFEALRSLAGGTDGPLLTFSVTLTEMTFVLYSVGRDGRPGGATAVGNAAGAADIIVFPAPISLERMRLESQK